MLVDRLVLAVINYWFGKEMNLNSGMEKKCSSKGQGSKLRAHGSKWLRGREGARWWSNVVIL